MRISDGKKGIDPKTIKFLIGKFNIGFLANAFYSNFAGKEEVSFADVTLADDKDKIWNVALKQDQEYVDIRLEEGLDYVGECLKFNFVGILGAVLNDIRDCAERAVEHQNRKQYTKELQEFLIGFRTQIVSTISSTINASELFKRNLVWYSLSGIPKHKGRPPSADYIITKSGKHRIDTADRAYITKCLNETEIIFNVSPNLKSKCMYNRVIPRIMKQGMEVKPPIRIARNLDEKMKLIIAVLTDMEKDLKEVRGFVNITTDSKIKIV